MRLKLLIIPLLLVAAIHNGYGQGVEYRKETTLSQNSAGRVLPTATAGHNNPPSAAVGSASADEAERDILGGMTINFKQGSARLDPYAWNNMEELDRFITILRSSENILSGKIDIMGYASPTLPEKLNDELAGKRAVAVRNYILDNVRYLRPSNFNVINGGENWDELKRLVEESTMPGRWQVIDIIENTPARIDYASNTSRKKTLMDLNGGQTWNYMLKNFFPQLRIGGVCIVYRIKKEEPSLPAETAPAVSEQPEPVVQTQEAIEAPTPVESEIKSTEQTAFRSTDYARKPLFAVKTNLLFDAASMINFEVEVPIGKRWSVAAEWMFPWWLWENKQNCFQLQIGTVEGRYWFGNRENRPQMTGWFAGVYGGYGTYDFEREKSGIQGKIVNVGISAGYAHAINKASTLRMEYSVGVGYLQTSPWLYEAQQNVHGEWELIKTVKRDIKAFAIPEHIKESDTWLLPYRAKVSLVWMINHRYNKKGGAR